MMNRPRKGVDPSAATRWRVAVAAAGIVLFWAATAQGGTQLPPPPLPENPAPLAELLTDQEKKLLSEARRPRRLVETYLAISDARLAAASAAITNEDNRAAERELDVYNKATAEAARLAFSEQQQSERRTLTKKIEQRLLHQIKNLELINKLFPIERVAFAEAALKRAKQLRVQALNATFASGDILKDTSEETRKPDNEVPEQDFTPRTDHPARPLPSPFVYAHRIESSQIPGDYLTEEEDDHVRQAQKADDRIKVFMKIADRRLAAIIGPASPAPDAKSRKKAEEEERQWGVLPELPRSELLRHYARAIEEAMAKLDDAYDRNPKSSAIGRALATLAEATDRHLKILQSLASDIRNEKEDVAFRRAVSQAEVANEGAKKRPIPK
ncbi:MAG TPA: hypothetical protein VJH03_17175 [Blastocatellia bacterium]|nr:hypothetical protein [Blastocatellia bacterium]